MTSLPLRWKNRKILIRFLEFPSVKFLKIWQKSYSLLVFLAFNLSEKFVRQGFRLAKKNTKMLKTKKLPWQPLLFSILKVCSCQTLPSLSISENFTEGNWRKLKSKPNRRYPGCQRFFSRWGRQNWAAKRWRRVAKRREKNLWHQRITTSLPCRRQFPLIDIHRQSLF